MSEPRAATRVMLCDDHELVREGLRTLIERQSGLSMVGEAATVAEAIETAARSRPDVVIMDVRLSDTDATHFLRFSRDFPATE